MKQSNNFQTHQSEMCWMELGSLWNVLDGAGISLKCAGSWECSCAQGTVPQSPVVGCGVQGWGGVTRTGRCVPTLCATQGEVRNQVQEAQGQDWLQDHFYHRSTEGLTQAAPQPRSPATGLGLPAQARGSKATWTENPWFLSPKSLVRALPESQN